MRGQRNAFVGSPSLQVGDLIMAWGTFAGGSLTSTVLRTDYGVNRDKVRSLTQYGAGQPRVLATRQLSEWATDLIDEAVLIRRGSVIWSFRRE